MKPTYIKTTLTSIVNISKIVTVHYYEFDKNFVFEGESHNFWEMTYIDRGRVLVCRDDEEIELGQGEIIFHRPNEFHSIRALDSAPNFFVVSFVCTSPAMQYFEKHHSALNKPLRNFISAIVKEAEQTYVIPKNDTSLKKLTKKENAPIGAEQLIKTYLEQLFIFLIRDITKAGEISVFPNKESMENHLITSIKSLIAENVEHSLRVEDICARIGYSKSYLSSLFRDQTGTTITGYSTRMKIDAAKRMIREDGLNFAQISDRLSFDNPQYFSRVFKRVTGMSPTEFKHSLNL